MVTKVVYLNEEPKELPFSTLALIAVVTFLASWLVSPNVVEVGLSFIELIRWQS